MDAFNKAIIQDLVGIVLSPPTGASWDCRNNLPNMTIPTRLFFYTKGSFLGLERKFSWLRAFAALLEDPILVSSTHMTTHNCL